MKRKTRSLILTLFTLFLFINGFSQPFRYTETIFTKIDTLKNVEYATAEWLNNPIAILAEYNIHDGENRTETRPLYMDIFMPKNDTLTNRPAIIFSHSGAFLIGSRQNDDMIALCDSFARRGYVTATIDYRLGMGATVSRIFGMIVGLSVDKENACRAAYRSVQDARAAIRYLKQNAEEYGIDSSKVFMAGSSAGGIQTLSTNYLDKQNEIPEYAFFSPSLGGLDTVGVFGPDAKASAIISLWGSILDIKILENKNTPLFLVHGENDDVVPFKKGIPLRGNIPENPIVSFNMPETYGSFCIDTALQNLGIFPETYFVKEQKHEFYGVETGMFPMEGPNQYWDTIQQKMTEFLFKQIQPTAEFNFTVNGRTLTTLNGATTNYIVSWDFGDGNISTEFQPEHNYESEGEYKIKLTVCNENMACDTVTYTVTIDSVQTSSKYKIENILIYPNPASNKLNVTGISQPFNILIYDFAGRIQISRKSISQNQINISSLKPGIYFVEIKNRNTSIARKFSKIP